MIIALTGAAGRIGYNTIFRIWNEFNTECYKIPIELRCIEVEPMMPVMHRIIDELKDCNFPNFEIKATTSYEEGFKNADLIILVGSALKKAHEPRSSLLEKNVLIFADLAKYIPEKAKTLVVANPSNTLCYVAMKVSKRNPNNFFSLSRLDFQRANFALSKKLNISLNRISNLVVLGNHSPKMLPIIKHACCDGRKLNLEECTLENNLQKWCKEDFKEHVRYRNNNIEKLAGYSSTFSAASAILNQIKEIMGIKSCRMEEKRWTVIGVYAEKELGKDCYVSLPVHFDHGKFDIIFNELALDTEELNEFDESIKEILEEKNKADDILSKIC